MIRLHTLVAVLCAIAVTSMAALFYRQANSVLSSRFQDLEAMQLDSVTRYSQTVLDARKYLLEAVRETLAQDGATGKALLAAYSKNPGYRGERESAKYRRAGKLDIVELIRISDTERLLPFIPKELLERAVREEASGSFFGVVNGKEALLSYSPVRVYGGAIAIGLLGYFLNEGISHDVGAATRSKVRFSLDAKPNTGERIIDLATGKEPPTPIKMYVSTDVVRNLNRDMLGGITAVGLWSLALSAALLYWLQNLMFLKSFRAVVTAIKAGSDELDAGRVVEIPAKKYPTTEVTELSQSVASYTSGLVAFQKQVERKTRDEIVGQMTSQVIHDLGGAIALLDKTLGLNEYAEFSPSRKIALQDVLRRLRGVAGGVRKKLEVQRDSSRDTAGSTAGATEVIPLLVSAIVDEKRCVYASRPGIILRTLSQLSDFDSYANVDASEFQRALSNIIDNAVQACGEQGEVTVSVVSGSSEIRVIVEDTGTGIPAAILPHLGKRGYTHGKEGGSGLGLWHATECLKRWGGRLEIESSANDGTEIGLVLPRQEPPKWFAHKLRIPSGTSEVVILDDDVSVHESWAPRLQDLRPTVSVRRFDSAEKLVVAAKRGKEISAENAWFLVDFDLAGESWTGLQVIEELGVAGRSVLVTGHYLDEKLRRECERLGVRLLPKSLLLHVPIVTSRHKAKRARAGSR